MAITDGLNNQSSSTDQNLRLSIMMKLEKLRVLKDKAESLCADAKIDINRYYWEGYIQGINSAIKQFTNE